jgi:hypothetical protein
MVTRKGNHDSEHSDDQGAQNNTDRLRVECCVNPDSDVERAGKVTSTVLLHVKR